MTLKCGADDPDNPTKVLGNGVAEGLVSFAPGWNKYELT